MRSWAGVTIGTDGTATAKSAGVLNTTRISAGIYEITLATNYGIDATQCGVQCTEVGTLAASGISSFAVNHVSDTVKRVSCLREGATGAASALADMVVSVTIQAYPAGDTVN